MKVETRRVTVALILAVILLISLYFIVRYIVDNQNRDTVAALDTRIFDQEKLLISLAEATRVNGADAATERIIVDCKADERQQFDKLLDLLSANISASQLTELNTLFYKCGSFYSDRKSVMATRLVREVEILSEYLTLRSVMSTVTDVESKKLESWKNLAEAELKTAEYFNQLVLLQGKIITELNSGKKPGSPELLATLNDVNNVRGQMLILSKQIEVFKTEALTL
jgi:hypothetical protein